MWGTRAAQQKTSWGFETRFAGGFHGVPVEQELTMNLKHIAAASALTVGVGLSGLLGLGTAAADPGPGPCGPQPGACEQHPGQEPNRGPGGGPDQGPGPDWNGRGIDQGRQDHQPFNYNGQRVNPVWDDNHHGWGFWFLGLWIPL
jgi:hypothetical protein